MKKSIGDRNGMRFRNHARERAEEQPAKKRNSILKRGQTERPALPSFAEEWLEELSGKK